MNHDEAKAQVAALFEARQADVRREALLEHLHACESCRDHYDRAAHAMRRALGTPDEMTPEELWLFEPPLPPAAVVPLFRPGRALGLALAASLAAIAAWYTLTPKPGEFGTRGGPTVAVTPSARALCMRGDEIAKGCGPGDNVMFAVSARGQTHVKLYDGERLVAEGDVADAPDTPLPWTVPWQPGAQLSVRFSKCATCESVEVRATP